MLRMSPVLPACCPATNAAGNPQRRRAQPASICLKWEMMSDSKAAVRRSPTDPFIERVRTTIVEHQMLVPGERVVVALSGGPDSVALLAALVALSRELQVELFAAHLNHGLRGTESLRDEDHALAVASQLGVACVVDRLDISATCSNLEEKGRELRYGFLRRVARDIACHKIATGHTLDDQAETVLMRIVRGAGLDGLAGIPAVRAGIIRPLLGCERAQVVEFLAAQGLEACQDSSNLDRRFLRNRIRQDVLPMLDAAHPGVTRRLAAAAITASAEARRLDALLAPQLARFCDASDGSLAVEVFEEIDSGLGGRLVRSWLRQVRGHLRQLNAAHVEAIIHIATDTRPNACVDLPSGEQVWREYEKLRWLKTTPQELGCVQIHPEGRPVVVTSGWKVRAWTQMFAGTVPRDPTLLSCVADADAVSLPLVVRCPHPGDRIRPFGMVGRKKLQDLFVDRKVPKRIQQTLPIVEAGGEILWVPGVVRSNMAVITAETRRILGMAAEQVGIAGV